MCSGAGNTTTLVLGFPIRTPPDHSSVANSPGLIAGSNVLHRLLMPRHPPCALHSLSQQRQNNTRQNKHIRHTNPPPNQRGEPATHNSTQPARNQPATPITSTTTNPPNAPPDKQG